MIKTFPPSSTSLMHRVGEGRGGDGMLVKLSLIIYTSRKGGKEWALSAKLL